SIAYFSSIAKHLAWRLRPGRRHFMPSSGRTGSGSPGACASVDRQFALHLLEQAREDTRLGLGDGIPNLDRGLAKNAFVVAFHLARDPTQHRGPLDVLLTGAAQVKQGGLGVVMGEEDLDLGFVEHEHGLRRLPQYAEEAFAARGGNRVEGARALAAALRALRYEPVARELLEGGIQRTVAYPVKEAHRIAKAALEVVAGRLAVHQESENRKLHVDSRRDLFHVVP